jgi:hypothetical protein
MIATALSCVLFAQAPMAALAVADPSGAASEAIAVRGDAELTPAAAYDSARTRAELHLQERWLERGRRLVVEQRPFWLPSLLAERAVARWLAGSPASEGMRIVDRDDRKREHEFGSSWQTTLWVAEDPRHVAHGERALRRELERVQQRTLLVSGGTVAFWAGLLFVLAWLDRLSRGYMTGRLRLVGLVLGAAVPAVAFLL